MCSSRTAAALLATATRRPPSCCAASGAPVRASPLRVLPSARGASQASGTRCRPASPSASAGPASALRCCAPPAAGRAAPVTHAPPCDPLPGAPGTWVSVAHPSVRHRAPGDVPPLVPLRFCRVPLLCRLWRYVLLRGPFASVPAAVFSPSPGPSLESPPTPSLIAAPHAILWRVNRPCVAVASAAHVSPTSALA
ncbi:unnamed protein product [Closterium sp. NIES-65]|nr:unnamed protein product [Closterium sp. NIES-65]